MLIAASSLLSEACARRFVIPLKLVKAITLCAGPWPSLGSAQIVGARQSITKLSNVTRRMVPLLRQAGASTLSRWTVDLDSRILQFAIHSSALAAQFACTLTCVLLPCPPSSSEDTPPVKSLTCIGNLNFAPTAVVKHQLILLAHGDRGFRSSEA